MDFTREPIIESVITPKEGCKLVVRSSKGAGQEEFFVDAVEVVSFGNTFFLRSLERPKSFIVPATDYEVLEVRETRMVLKSVGVDRSIKIGGGREASKKGGKGAAAEKAPPEKIEKKKERRRHYRRRRGREETTEKDEEGNPEAPPVAIVSSETMVAAEGMESAEPALTAILPPPSTLISETIARYKDDQLFKDVFFPEEGEFMEEKTEGDESIPLEEPEADPFLMPEMDKEISLENTEDFTDPFAIIPEEADNSSAPSSKET